MPMLDILDTQLFVIDEGAGRPLVFIHGFPLNHTMWDAQRRVFRDTHRVIIPDLRGFGRSSLGESIATPDQLTIDQFARDIDALLTTLAVSDQVVLCGLSLGCCIALAFARLFPERLAGLVLCDGRANPESPEGITTRLKMAERVVKEGAGIAAEAMLPRLFGPKTNEGRPQVVDAIRNLILATSPRSIAAGQHALAYRPDANPGLAAIAVPTQILVGEHDLISPPAEMRAIADQIPGARYNILPKAGHMSPNEAPEAFNAALQTFLAEC